MSDIRRVATLMEEIRHVFLDFVQISGVTADTFCSQKLAVGNGFLACRRMTGLEHQVAMGICRLVVNGGSDLVISMLA